MSKLRDRLFWLGLVMLHGGLVSDMLFVPIGGFLLVGLSFARAGR